MLKSSKNIVETPRKCFKSGKIKRHSGDESISKKVDIHRAILEKFQGSYVVAESDVCLPRNDSFRLGSSVELLCHEFLPITLSIGWFAQATIIK